MSSQEARQRRAISILVLLGSILFVVATWNYPSRTTSGSELGLS